MRIWNRKYVGEQKPTPLSLLDAGRVRRERLADIVVAAEMIGRAARPVAALHGAGQALVELAGGHADIERLAAGQAANLRRELQRPA